MTMSRRIKNEYFVPDESMTLEDYLSCGERTPVHHIIRYEWAEAVLAHLDISGTVLDMACGAGYGAYRIAQRFPKLQVVGADYDAEAISFASSEYSAPNLSFMQANVEKWDETLGGVRNFNCIISFDTIEHVEHREIMMQGLVEHMEPEGVLLLSTPVRSENVLNPGWEHHKIEFSRRALYDFLRRYFEEVLAPDFNTMPCQEGFSRVNRDEQVYLLKMNPLLCRHPIRISFGH